MPKHSAGLLLFRERHGALEVLLAHPGGPFFRNKDEGAWSLPKGERHEGESALACAMREFREETGLSPGDGPFLELGEIQQKGGKRVHAFAARYSQDVPPLGDDVSRFELEWPPRSGKRASFPEIDQLTFFPLEEAAKKLNPAQVTFLTRLVELLRERT
jgi:predicted NUDIX family NTP pyrophosphohydrolase